jgi:hypothetical protein
MRLLTAFASMLTLACSDAPPSVTPPPVVEPPVAPKPVPVAIDDGRPVDLLPPGVAPEDPYRERRRMDLDQLSLTIRTVTGGIGWTETRNGTEVDLFEELALTLGKPDYLTVTTEILDPSAMFQKFLDDAARAVCTELMTVEGNRAPADRVFFVEADATDSYEVAPDRVVANLRRLLLRFHGRQLAHDAPELERWIWLMRSAEHVTKDQGEVWRTVCVGLMTHPDFYTY